MDIAGLNPSECIKKLGLGSTGIDGKNPPRKEGPLLA